MNKLKIISAVVSGIAALFGIGVDLYVSEEDRKQMKEDNKKEAREETRRLHLEDKKKKRKEEKES